MPGQRIHRGGIIRLTDYHARVFQLAAILPPSFLLDELDSVKMSPRKRTRRRYR